MALKKFKPRSPEIYLNKIEGDNTFARLGHLNGMVDDVEEHKADQELHKLDHPFYGFPESTLFNAGPFYQFPGGTGMGIIPETTLNSYKLSGILGYSGSSVISQYLGTIKLIPNTSGAIPFAYIFPGKLTGMVMAANGEVTWSSKDLINTPLADGAMMWDVDADDFNKLNDVKIMLYSYGDPDIDTGEANYAVVLEAYGTVPTADLATAIISYNFEFIAPSDSKVSLWWD